jgi:hypothetical protein
MRKLIACRSKGRLAVSSILKFTSQAAETRSCGHGRVRYPTRAGQNPQQLWFCGQYLWALAGVEVGSRRRLVMQRRILLLLLLLCRLVRLRLVCWVPSIVLGAAILRRTYESR